MRTGKCVGRARHSWSMNTTIGIWSESVLAGHAVVALSSSHHRWRWLGQYPSPIPPDQNLAALVVVWDHFEVGRTLTPVIREAGVGADRLVLLGPGARKVAGVIGIHTCVWCWEPDEPVESLRELIAALSRGGSDAPELSTQETRVLQLLAEGLKVAAVARRLEVSPHTVHTYLRRTRRKFADHGRPVSSSLGLYRAALEWGLLDAHQSAG